MRFYEMTFVSKDWKLQSGKAWDDTYKITISARNPRHALTLCGAGETIQHFSRVTSQSYYSVSSFNRNETNVAYKDITGEYVASVKASNLLTEDLALAAARKGLIGVESVTLDPSRANLYTAKLTNCKERAYIWLPEYDGKPGNNIFVAFSTATMNFRVTDVERDAIKAVNPDGLTARIDEGRCTVCGTEKAVSGGLNCESCQTTEDALQAGITDSFAAQYELTVKGTDSAAPACNHCGNSDHITALCFMPRLSLVPRILAPTVCSVCSSRSHATSACPLPTKYKNPLPLDSY